MGRRPTTGQGALADLERYLKGAGRRRSSLSEVERTSIEKCREIARLSLQAHLDGRGDGDVGPHLSVVGPTGPLRLSYKRRRTRRIVTVVGELSITRIGYGAPGQASIHPLDAELCLPARSFSYEVQRHLVRAAVCGPFDEAVRVVAELTGVSIPKRSAEQIVLDAACDVDSFYERRSGATLQPNDLLVGAIDGKGIPMKKPTPARRVVRRKKGEKPNKKKMATVAAVFAAAPRKRTPTSVLESLFREDPAPSGRRHRREQRPKDKRVWASLLAGKDSFIADVGAEMARRDPDHERTWVIVTDGERALQRRVISSFPTATLVLDIFHATEKLWPCAHALYDEASPEAVAFVKERTERILKGEVSQVVKGLRLIATKRRLRGEKQKAFCKAADYFYANRTRMRYDLYLRRGWPIASGAVEGTCKCLVRDRMVFSSREPVHLCPVGRLTVLVGYTSSSYCLPRAEVSPARPSSVSHRVARRPWLLERRRRRVRQGGGRRPVPFRPALRPGPGGVHHPCLRRRAGALLGLVHEHRAQPGAGSLGPEPIRPRPAGHADRTCWRRAGAPAWAGTGEPRAFGRARDVQARGRGGNRGSLGARRPLRGGRRPVLAGRASP